MISNKARRLAPASLFTHVMTDGKRVERPLWNPHRATTHDIEKALLQGQHRVAAPMSSQRRLTVYLTKDGKLTPGGKLTPRQRRRAHQKHSNPLVWMDEV